MPTMLEHAEALAAKFQNQRVYLPAMAEVFWPGADWLNVKIGRNNGGARKGARLAAGLAGKMARKGYLKLDVDFDTYSPTAYRVDMKAIRSARDELDSKGNRGRYGISCD